MELDEIFEVLIHYLDEKDPIKIENLFNEASKTIDNYSLQAKKYGTNYSCNYLEKLSSKLLNLLNKHFEKSPYSKPAELTVEGLEKKYPFQYKNKELNLNFIIKNNGLGYAHKVYFETDSEDLQIKELSKYLGYIEPNTSVVIDIPAKVINSKKSIEILYEIEWTNYDKSVNKKEKFLYLKAQRSDIDWDNLEGKNPYSLEAVETEDELVGREEVLQQLLTQAKAKSTISSFIYGQKRVGKTSVVKTLKSQLEKICLNNYLVVYFMAGDYIKSDPTKTIIYLGQRLCKKIRKSDSRFNDIEIPDFTDSFSPITEFLESILEIEPNYKILFILDEFDDLPIELYKRGSIGNAFFSTLRSISSRGPFSFILVCSENMKYIMDFQGERLNKFQPFQLNYFNRDEHWLDFQELVRRPVERWMEISDKAIDDIYAQTAGNPYFTKLICKRLFNTMVEHRDCHITHIEIDKIIKKTLQYDVSVNTVEHFWTDGIFETGDLKDKIILNRRQVLLCLAEVFRKYEKPREKEIIKLGKEDYKLSKFEIEYELRDFQHRQVLIKKDSIYDFKVPLFRDWLKEKGVYEIMISFPKLDKNLKYKKQEEEKRVSSKEIYKLEEKWNDFHYYGRSINTDKIRTWLEQFKEYSKQRLMFQILKNIKFYSEANIRIKMRDAHENIVTIGSRIRLKPGEKKPKRKDILVSYLESSPAKSGNYYARLYANVNKVYHKNVIEHSKIRSEIEKIKHLHALVFIDDFLGTGDSASEYFEELSKDCGEILKASNIKILFIVICGFLEAQEKVENVINNLDLPVEVHILDPIDELEKVFSDKSKNFPVEHDRIEAENICYEYGIKLERKIPLGYGDCQAIVVFANSCPNNTLPILWSDSGDWIPLFER